MKKKTVAVILGMLLGMSMNVYAESDFEFSQLPDTMYFSSGVGAWATQISVAEDGTFTGTYTDHDYDEEYPEGILYYCAFSGKFTEPEDMGDGVYCCEIESLETERVSGDREIDGDMLIEYSDPWGMQDAENILIYTPGTLEEFIPEDAQNAPLYMYQGIDGVIPENLYLLYNENADALFFGDTSNDIEALDDDYILSGVSERFVTVEEVEQLTLQEVNYAKNEIYAIHGRKFQSVELNDYFNSKSWYQGEIDGADFSDTVFNDYEKVNLMVLVERERELAGSQGYLLDQPGYDINAVSGAKEEDTADVAVG